MALDIYIALKKALEQIPQLQGPSGSARIYPTAAPEGAGLPHIVFSQQKMEAVEALDGPTGLSTAEIRLDIAARSYAEIVALSLMVKTAVASIADEYTDCLYACWTERQPEFYAENWDVIVRSGIAQFTINYY